MHRKVHERESGLWNAHGYNYAKVLVHPLKQDYILSRREVLKMMLPAKSVEQSKDAGESVIGE